MNLVEFIADEQHPSPCAYGNIVDGHACYCHHPEGLRKCPIWRKYGEEELDKWHNKGDWDSMDWDGGCRFFEPIEGWGNDRRKSMKVYKVELMFIDFDGIGQEELRTMLENMGLPNNISPPDVMSIEERDIGEWDDNSPLNSSDTQEAEFRRLFEDKCT